MSTRYEIQNRHPRNNTWQKTVGIQWHESLEDAVATLRVIQSGKVMLTHPGPEYRIVRIDMTVIEAAE